MAKAGGQPHYGTNPLNGLGGVFKGLQLQLERGQSLQLNLFIFGIFANYKLDGHLDDLQKAGWAMPLALASGQMNKSRWGTFVKVAKWVTEQESRGQLKSPAPAALLARRCAAGGSVQLTSIKGQKKQDLGSGDQFRGCGQTGIMGFVGILASIIIGWMALINRASRHLCRHVSVHLWIWGRSVRGIGRPHLAGGGGLLTSIAGKGDPGRGGFYARANSPVAAPRFAPFDEGYCNQAFLPGCFQSACFRR